jgi:rod shape determining protein RodA
MAAVLEKPSPWLRARRWLSGFDGPLAVAVFLLLCMGIVTVYSAGYDFPGRFQDHMRNILVAFIAMLFMAQVPPQRLLQIAVPLYVVGVSLLIAVALFGIVKKGSRRWINIGMVIQPSEIMKIATPLMLAWWFQKRESAGASATGVLDFIVAALILFIPTILIARQPDLGTAILVFSAGAFVIFFAGLSWKIIVSLAISFAAFVPLAWQYLLHDYQRERVLTLIDPTTDPLGKGFHIIQSTIAIGSGGLLGKGFLQGTQAHLEFIPERTTDFIFAVFSEEFGLLGCTLLILGFMFLIFRGMQIAAAAPTLFLRLLSSAVTMMFFTYAFVNMGMVSGILPVVGVPLPFISYGGTAMVTLGLAVGILMVAARHKRLVQS